MQDHKTTAPDAVASYDSNPFTTALTGLRKLIHTNAQTVVGVAFFNILLIVLTGVTAVILVLAVMAFVIKHTVELQSQIGDASVLSFINSITDSNLVATWIIGLAACLFLSALTQALQLNLTVAAAKSVTLKFGSLLKASIGSILPILGLFILGFLAIIVGIVALALLSTLLGPITFVIGLVAVLALIYGALRLSYATYAIVDRKLSPIAAIKYSWTLSRNHVLETVGVTAAAMVLVSLPSLILQATVKIVQDVTVLSSILSILDAVLMMILSIAATMILAERYAQLQTLHQNEGAAPKLSPLNYLALVIAILLMSLLGALSPDSQNDTDSALPNLFESTAPASEGSDDPAYRLN